MSNYEIDETALQTLIDLYRSSEHVVFFGGAGTSTESGVPDFRSKTGIYNQRAGAEQILTPRYMQREPEDFWAFCREYFLLDGIRPNDCHLGLAKLEEAGRLDAVITQNIDGLHQEAGSRNVIEVHGNVNQFSCLRCGTQYDAAQIRRTTGVPVCTRETAGGDCAGGIRPNIVLYEEGLDNSDVSAALEAIGQADLLIVGGTSLTVYPAAGFISYQKNGKLVLINRDPTPSDRRADLVLHANLGEVFRRLVPAVLN